MQFHVIKGLNKQFENVLTRELICTIMFCNTCLKDKPKLVQNMYSQLDKFQL